MTIPNNVIELIGRCSEAYGKHSQSLMHEDLINECRELGMESPIEQILYCGLKTVAKLGGIDECTDPIEIDGHAPGLSIAPQQKHGNYRVDFMVHHERLFKGSWEKNLVVVECDSQKFHDRTEPERRYEKKRDRFFAAQGIHVFHYTGAEIIKDPFLIAAEILAFVDTNRSSKDELYLYVQEAIG